MQPTELHCYYCFDHVLAKLDAQHSPQTPQFPDDCCPLFVTWTHATTEDLRGCIGNFGQLNLHEGLRDYARIAAFADSRFPPVQLTELRDLACTVSLLTDFEPASDWKDWQIGTHGIRIKYENKYSATFLPHVAEEQEWNHEQTLTAALRKSGYRGSVDEKVLSRVQVTRYQSKTCTKTFLEYERWKQISFPPQ